MAILLVQLVTRSQRRSSAGISNTIALRKLGTRNCPCLNRFLSLKAPPLAAGDFFWGRLARRPRTPGPGRLLGRTPPHPGVGFTPAPGRLGRGRAGGRGTG